MELRLRLGRAPELARGCSRLRCQAQYLTPIWPVKGADITVRARHRQRRRGDAVEAAWRVAVERSGRSGGDRRICHSRDPRRDRRRTYRCSASASAIRCWHWRSAPRRTRWRHGHHGANHPVKDLDTGKVEIVSMNHGFTVDRETLPKGVAEDPCLAVRRQQLRHRRRRQAGVLGAVPPEASPGPMDSHYLFERFAAAAKARASWAAA